MRRRQPIHKTDAMTVAQARLQLTMMLASARDLDRFTVDQLARSYKVPVREIEQRIAAEREKRMAVS